MKGKLIFSVLKCQLQHPRYKKYRQLDGVQISTDKNEEKVDLPEFSPPIFFRESETEKKKWMSLAEGRRKPARFIKTAPIFSIAFNHRQVIDAWLKINTRSDAGADSTKFSNQSYDRELQRKRCKKLQRN
jgi:hypothetical protein